MMRFHAVVLVSLAGVVPASAIDVVVPNALPTTVGGGTFLGPLSNAQRTYQLLIHSDQMTGLVGANLTGLTWRLLPSATANWPAVDATYTSFEVRLSESVAPAARSLTFASNVVGSQTLVRSGALTITAGSFPFGAVTPNANAFGTTIEFGTSWLYTGGHVLVELRHTGHGAASASTDSVLTSGTGYGTQFSACWTGNAAGTAGSQGNFAVTRFTATPVAPACYANCDASTAEPVLNVADFTCFLTKYAAADAYANCDGSTSEPTLNVADFTCFLTKFAGGCR